MPSLSNTAPFDLPISPSLDGRDDHQRTDAELIERCLKQDNQAWVALLDRYGGLIYSIALKWNLASEDAADVFQSVCLAMLEGLEKLRDETKLNSWLTTVTQRHCYRVKRRQRRQPVKLDHVEEEVMNLPDAAPLPDEAVEQMERVQVVREALSMMDEPSRQLLTRLFYEKESWSYEAIAQEMGLAVATIGPKRGRCLKRLEGILHGLGF